MWIHEFRSEFLLFFVVVVASIRALRVTPNQTCICTPDPIRPNRFTNIFTSSPSQMHSAFIIHRSTYENSIESVFDFEIIRSLVRPPACLLGFVFRASSKIFNLNWEYIFNVFFFIQFPFESMNLCHYPNLRPTLKAENTLAYTFRRDSTLAQTHMNWDEKQSLKFQWTKCACTTA